ncbi:hypothetical protein AB9P05_20215 [Roseivirga sp. BDSF3-8]|uniref:hypothetical protein n=1 Tax=Roseivirga sp. BDSF3-8 TaxID=3241598 RepID=UPI003531D202
MDNTMTNTKLPDFTGIVSSGKLKLSDDSGVGNGTVSDPKPPASGGSGEGDN